MNENLAMTKTNSKYKQIKSIAIRPSKNRGAVLFVSLILLLTLTIIGLSAMNNSYIELKSASNTQENELAYQASQSGLDAVMCLSNRERTGTSDDNPFDKKYAILVSADTNPKDKFNWDWDKTYDKQNVSPFANVTQQKCSVTSGKLAIGKIGTSTTDTSNDLKVAVRRIPNSASLRATRGNSYKKLECHNYVIDSRYDYPTSGAKSYVWGEVCRQVGASN